MKAARIMLLLPIFILSAWTHAEQALNQVVIKEMILEMRNNIVSKQSQKIAANFLRGASIELDMATMGKGKLILTVPEYEQFIKTTFAASDFYDYHLDDSYIYVNPNNKTAFSSSVVTETVKIRGKTFKQTTQEKIFIKNVDGKPMIDKAEGKIVSFYEI